MTYCIAMHVPEGLVFVSDSRTTAGADRLSTCSKMHRLLCNQERTFVLLAAGNLGTTQGVLSALERDVSSGMLPNLSTVPTLEEAAECIGHASTTEQQKHHEARKGMEDFIPGASFILGGQIRGAEPGIFLIYPEGNFVRATTAAPYHQIGEVKYGKPIVERMMRTQLSLETAAQVGLVSMDSTLKNNATVGPPVELLLYPADSFNTMQHHVFDQDHPYWLTLRQGWEKSIASIFGQLPKLPQAGAGSAAVTYLDPQ